MILDNSSCWLSGDWLKRFSDVGRNHRASSEIYHLVKYGYKIKFLKVQSLVLTSDWKKAIELLKSKIKVFRDKVADLCAKGIRRRIGVDEANSTLGYKKFKLVVYKEFIREIDFS